MSAGAVSDMGGAIVGQRPVGPRVRVLQGPLRSPRTVTGVVTRGGEAVGGLGAAFPPRTGATGFRARDPRVPLLATPTALHLALRRVAR
jgi:hypothetical protein